MVTLFCVQIQSNTIQGKITQCKSKWFSTFFHIELMVILGIIFCIIQLLPDMVQPLPYSQTPAFKFKFNFTQLTDICLYLDISWTKDSFEILPQTCKPGSIRLPLVYSFWRVVVRVAFVQLHWIRGQANGHTKRIEPLMITFTALRLEWFFMNVHWHNKGHFQQIWKIANVKKYNVERLLYMLRQTKHIALQHCIGSLKGCLAQPVEFALKFSD